MSKVTLSPSPKICSGVPEAQCDNQDDGVAVQDDVGLQPVQDGFIQHNYVSVSDALLAEVSKDPGMAQFADLQARNNAKNGSEANGWKNDIMTFKNNYLEIIPQSFAGPAGGLGAAIGVQSSDSASALQANMAKLFGNTSAATVQLDVKDNAQPGDTTEHFAEHTREIPQFIAGKSLETGKDVFSGAMFGAWGTTENDPNTHAVMTADQTLASAYKPNLPGEHIIAEHGTLGAEDMANYAKMLAAGGYQVKLEGTQPGCDAPKLSGLEGYLKQQEAQGASVTLSAKSPNPDAMKVRIQLNEDASKQGFDENVIQLNEPSCTGISNAVGSAADGELTIKADPGSDVAVLSAQRPPPAPTPAPAPAQS